MEKRELYRLVEESSGDIAVKAKAHEEYTELEEVLSSLKKSIETNGDLTPKQYFSFIDEMADAIIVTEKIFRTFNTEGDISKRVKFKLNRLEQYLVDGALCKDLDTSVVKCG